LDLATQLIGLVLEQAIIVLFLIYFCYFFQKKKESLTRQYGVFTTNQKLIVIWCLLVFILNGLIFFASGVIKVMNIFDGGGGESALSKFWLRFRYFWFQILILNNGIIFLFLFKHLAKFKSQKRGGSLPKRRARKDITPKATQNGIKGTSSSKDTFKQRYDSVSRLNRILAKGTSAYTGRSGPKSIDPFSSVNQDQMNNLGSLNSEIGDDQLVDDDQTTIRRMA
jgi:hypothetical protein